MENKLLDNILSYYYLGSFMAGFVGGCSVFKVWRGGNGEEICIYNVYVVLFGGRSFREGLHARFTRMYIWAVARFASNGPYGIELV